MNEDRTEADADRALEADLVARARDGDPEAYGRLAERYAAPLAAVAFARTGERETARDLAQEALIEGYERLGELADPQRLGAWLYGICRNRAVSWVRRRGAERRANRRRQEAREAGRREAETPAQAAARSEEEDRVLAGLAELAEHDREILLLRYAGGLGRQETAALLGLSPAATDKRLQRAAARLRERLAAGPDDGNEADA
jgi:RNA polymerase sigma-70 factor (ECF subfamily)